MAHTHQKAGRQFVRAKGNPNSTGGGRQQVTESMRELAQLVKTFDGELRKALMTSRSGLFRNARGELFIQSNVPLGQSYSDEVVGIFADPADLDFYYKIYLSEEN